MRYRGADVSGRVRSEPSVHRHEIRAREIAHAHHALANGDTVPTRRRSGRLHAYTPTRLRAVKYVRLVVTGDEGAAKRVGAINRAVWSWLSRHRRWVIPLVAIPVSYLIAAFGSTAIRSNPDASTDVGLMLALIVLAALGFLGPIVALVLTVVGAIKTWKRWRRANGHFPVREQAAYDAAVASQLGAADAWDAARILRQHLLAGSVPPPIRVWEIVPRPGEVMFLDLPADYARYYGQDASYSQSSGFYFGHPLFVVAGLAANAVGNAARRNSALAHAREQWREQQPTRVVVTNQRLVCLAAGQWLSFPYSSMSAVYPETSTWTLICQFPDVPPLLLAGHGTPLVSVMTMMMTHGRAALSEHPSLLGLESRSSRRPGNS